MFDLFAAGRHFRPGPAVHDANAFRTQAQRSARGVHGHVACAKHGDIAAQSHRRVVFGEGMRPSEVHAREVFVGGENADAVFVGHVEEMRQSCAHAKEHGVISAVQQSLHGHGAPAHMVELEIHAHFGQAVQLAVHHVLGQTEGGYPVDQNAARLMQPFEHRHVDAILRKQSGACQRRRTGTDACDALPAFFCPGGRLCGCVVGDKTLQASDGHGLPFLAQDALAFALLFLRADAAADSGQAARFMDDAAGFVDIAEHDLTDEFRDRDVHRASCAAQGLFALQAARRLFRSHFGRIAEGDLGKIPDPLGRRLAWHLVTGYPGPLDIGLAHVTPPSFQSNGSGAVPWRSAPEHGRSRGACAIPRNPPRAHRIPDRQRR